ncbi:preprotein translocase subunit SecE [Candidatus Curtissbacteria bacterium RIFCSPHIGHO2_01_FULL_41_13]|uniref:Protein translocase subunit SecE n=1 Tax=Candidatus Curtissbacteria bacterium RIFCSPHIGHO2_01_FULL_41_13 TaxID=1797745 RepID=A0A1F5FZY5_9BACT|nr:MAG: preprotein translocase subunit SecE [Candidatus Curtissbacteria bacterium RIFCSPHIGHO2_01_FULL_41_13]
MAINPIAYLKESKAEFDKVIWPNRQETLRLTLVVLFISLVVGAYIVGLDAIFTTIVEKFLK